jgi:hypothetical protein
LIRKFQRTVICDIDFQNGKTKIMPRVKIFYKKKSTFSFLIN